MDKKTCVITGLNGQLGQFLAKYLQENEPDIQIIGTLRHKSYDAQPYIFDKTKVIFELMDLSDSHSIENLILKYKPDYFINTAANAYVGESWAVPYQQIELNTIGVLHQLESIRKHSPYTRYFNMGTSEEFACCENKGTQNEDTKIFPRSPYGCAKAASRYLVNVYRNSYNLYALQGWTFNFESELRGEKYVTKKITKGIARIYHAIKNKEPFDPIELGNLNSNRSWQFCGDVADGIWRMLNQEKYNGYLTSDFEDAVFHYIHTGQNEHSNEWDIQWLSKRIKEYVLSAPDTYTIKNFIELAFKKAEIEGYWQGEGLNEKYIIANYLNEIGEIKSQNLISINSKFFRPLDVTFLHGDAAKIKNDLGWESKTSFDELVTRMINYDIENYKS